VSHDEPVIRIEVTPEPSPDEADALVAAIAVYLSAGVEQTVEPAAPVVSRWVIEGRRTAMSGLQSGSNQGWGRGRPG
jgi:hypothetical protein